MRLDTKVVRTMGWSDGIVVQVCEFIVGHDTRAEPRHRNDRIARDAGNLWRHKVKGTAVGCDWFGQAPQQTFARKDTMLPQFETKPRRLSVAPDRSGMQPPPWALKIARSSVVPKAGKVSRQRMAQRVKSQSPRKKSRVESMGWVMMNAPTASVTG